MTTLTNMPTLAAALWPVSGATAGSPDAGRAWGRALALAFAGSLLMTLSAKIQIPFWPVPMTMQTFVVLVLGMAYGWKLGAATMLMYLAEGAMGFPVFAGTPERGIGLAYMTGPTGGYLVGFVVAAAACGWLAQRGWDRSVAKVMVAMLLGHALILGMGAAWLATLMGWEKALQVGLMPFWAATLFKTALAVMVLPVAWRLLGKR